jgi:Calcineurin-like phosphoesterase
MLVLVLFLGSCAHPQVITRPSGSPLTVIAIGDQGTAGSVLTANASSITDMYTGRDPAGSFDLLLFLGDNFYNTGLNIPKDQVDDKIESVLGQFRVPLDGLGRARVHAVTGNHDYYAKNVIDIRTLFGLVDIEEIPVGLSDRGNEREAGIPSWTYHYGMPADLVVPLRKDGVDSAQFVFFDSAIPLRTRPETWGPALDSLNRLLNSVKGRSHVQWHILVMHHPIATVGEHGGYTEWNDETKRVEYLTQCDKDSNAVGWVKNFINPEDLCTDRYRTMLDSLRFIIDAAGVPFQAVLSGHDHCLQFLYRPHGETPSSWPQVQIVSGAGSHGSRVMFPAPPFSYTASDPKAKGESATGFARLQFQDDRMRVVFYDGFTGDPIDMGGGKKEFWIDQHGAFLETQ